MKKALELLLEIKEVEIKRKAKGVYLYQDYLLQEQLDQLKKEYRSLTDKEIKCRVTCYFKELLIYDNYNELVVYQEHQYEDGTNYYGAIVPSKDFLSRVNLIKPIEDYKEGELLMVVDTKLELQL